MTDGKKAPLLSKATQIPPRTRQSSVPTASPLNGGHAARGGASRVSDPMTSEFDPGANKTKRDVRFAAAPSSRATEPAVKLPENSQVNKDEGSGKPPLSKSKAPAQIILRIRSLTTRNHLDRLGRTAKAAVRPNVNSSTILSTPSPFDSSKANAQRTQAIWNWTKC
uniref:Uncharacterized protein n=1 Tax=Peronospora matthiolae TaxID=2874970 RepID=A0AAV1VFT9_9STRA